MEIASKTASGGEKASADKNNKQKCAQSSVILEKSLIRNRMILGSKPWSSGDLRQISLLLLLYLPSETPCPRLQNANPESQFGGLFWKLRLQVAVIISSHSEIWEPMWVLTLSPGRPHREGAATATHRLHSTDSFQPAFLRMLAQCNEVLVNNVDFWAWPRTTKSKLLQMGYELWIHTLKEQPE